MHVHTEVKTMQVDHFSKKESPQTTIAGAKFFMLESALSPVPTLASAALSDMIRAEAETCFLNIKLQINLSMLLLSLMIVTKQSIYSLKQGTIMTINNQLLHTQTEKYVKLYMR